MEHPPHVFHWNDLPWDNPLAGADPARQPPKELVDAARKSGAKRKKVVRGEAGFYMNRSTMGPGFRVPPHQHDHDELIVVLSGGCVFDNGLADLGPGDSIVIHGGTRYGFTCAEEGMEFLTIRTGEATVTLEPKS
ncbi:MAG: cupin domain-containing protein [Candidatus Binatia bacterium]|nr:cupin domain-containing protein [Candidatus Binatia bacterium]